MDAPEIASAKSLTFCLDWPSFGLFRTCGAVAGLALGSSLTRPTDMLIENVTVGMINSRKGWNATTYMRKLLREIADCDCLDYNLSPGVGKGYNSNGFVSGIVRAAAGHSIFRLMRTLEAESPFPVPIS